MSEVIKSYKGFNKDMTCRDFKYEIGETYEIEGDIKACRNGFHACEYPLDVFSYYYPSESVFCEVEQSGEVSKKKDGDSKIASSSITIKAFIDLPSICKAAIEYTHSRTKKLKAKHSTKDESHASNTGDYSAASNTGNRSAASVTGKHSAAMASGYEGKVMGTKGNALFLVERNGDYEIINAWSGIVGKDGIKENVWYMLKDGKPVEV